VIAVALVSGLVIASGAARSPKANGVGPVSHRLLQYLSSERPLALRLTRHRVRPKVTRAEAIKDAVRDARWRPASVTGISLVRFEHRTGGVAAWTLAWLASVKPRRPVYDGTKTSPGPAANYCVVVIRARDGRFLADEDGYSPSLANRSGSGGWATGEYI